MLRPRAIETDASATAAAAVDDGQSVAAACTAVAGAGDAGDDDEAVAAASNDAADGKKPLSVARPYFREGAFRFLPPSAEILLR